MRVLLLTIGGLVLGLIGGLVQTYVFRVGSVDLPAGAVLVLATLIPLTRAAAWWQGSRWGAAAFSLGWMAATLMLGVTTPSGDLVLTSGTRQTVYLMCCGVLLAAASGYPLLDPDRGGTPASEDGTTPQAPSEGLHLDA